MIIKHGSDTGCERILKEEKPQPSGHYVKIYWCGIHKVEVCQCGIEWGKHGDFYEQYKNLSIQNGEQISESIG